MNRIILTLAMVCIASLSQGADNAVAQKPAQAVAHNVVEQGIRLDTTEHMFADLAQVFGRSPKAAHLLDKAFTTAVAKRFAPATINNDLPAILRIPQPSELSESMRALLKAEEALARFGIHPAQKSLAAKYNALSQTDRSSQDILQKLMFEFMVESIETSFLSQPEVITHIQNQLIQIKAYIAAVSTGINAQLAQDVKDDQPAKAERLAKTKHDPITYIDKQY